jgi:hypothetical protein
MTKQIQSIVFAACLAAFLPIGAAVFFDMPMAQAKECSVEMPAKPHGQWWSYRIIDGRKCWYEGKPMLPKSALHWPAQASAHQAPAQSRSGKETASRTTEKSDDVADPDTCCWPALDSNTFEERWRGVNASIGTK